MAELESAGTAQARKIYLRHGAREPLFGVSFASLKAMAKRIGVDHELACGLWETGNLDARNLAAKVVDPHRMSPDDIDRWAGGDPMVSGYIASIAVETSHAYGRANAWLADARGSRREVAWALVGAMALRDETTPDEWFVSRLADIERTIHHAPNGERTPMNHALIAIGCRSAALRELATAAAKRIGKIDVDHGDTACETIDAAERIEKTWKHSLSKGFETPAAHERSRVSMRLRC